MNPLNPIITLTSHDSRTKGKPVFVSALHVQGIEPSDELWEGEGDEHLPVRIQLGGGRYEPHTTSLVWWGNDSHHVRETPKQVSKMLEDALNSVLAARKKP